MITQYKCLLCEREIKSHELQPHKNHHQSFSHYGFMWPTQAQKGKLYSCARVPTYTSTIIAEILGVQKVYIRDEGMNISGSMKDYVVQQALDLGLEEKYDAFTVVSSGNHAVALATFASSRNAKSIVFTTASSSKIPFLAQLPRTLVIGVREAIFEDVYLLANRITLDGVYNANVSNDQLLTSFQSVALSIASLDPLPTHIIAGVGNGSYLAGIAHGIEHLKYRMPKIIPVGMDGAFPTEEAFAQRKMVHEYEYFLVDEKHIDAAEGSIAIASYSMPQLIHSIHLSSGFTLGGLTNDDLRNAYLAIKEDKHLVFHGAIPEPTGIMSLAAALKHRTSFEPKDILFLSFTGHGTKDKEGIKKLVPEISEELLRSAEKCRPDLQITPLLIDQGNVIMVDKNTDPSVLNQKIQHWLQGEKIV